MLPLPRRKQRQHETTMTDAKRKMHLAIQAEAHLCAVSGRTAWRRERSSMIRIHDVEAL